MFHCRGRLSEQDKVMRKRSMVETVIPAAGLVTEARVHSLLGISLTFLCMPMVGEGKEGTLCRCSLTGEYGKFKILLCVKQ